MEDKDLEDARAKARSKILRLIQTNTKLISLYEAAEKGELPPEVIQARLEALTARMEEDVKQ